MSNVTNYPPMTIELDVYYYFEDDSEKVCIFDEDEMRTAFENKLEELKNKYSKSDE